MKSESTSIPRMLVKTRGNMSELGRLMGVSRLTVRRYAKDFECKSHVVFNGVLMVTQGNRGQHKKRCADEV